jgi:hypothetical protein
MMLRSMKFIPCTRPQIPASVRVVLRSTDINSKKTGWEGVILHLRVATDSLSFRPTQDTRGHTSVYVRTTRYYVCRTLEKMSAEAGFDLSVIVRIAVIDSTQVNLLPFVSSPLSSSLAGLAKPLSKPSGPRPGGYVRPRMDPSQSMDELIRSTTPYSVRTTTYVVVLPSTSIEYFVRSVPARLTHVPLPISRTRYSTCIRTNPVCTDTEYGGRICYS